jgi:hypothetical protein
VGLKVFTALIFLVMFLWFKAPCGPVGRSQRYGEAFCLRLQGGRSVLSPCSTLEMETARFSKAFASSDQSTWRRNPKERHFIHVDPYLVGKKQQ